MAITTIHAATMNFVSISNVEANKRLKSYPQIYRRDDKHMFTSRFKETVQQSLNTNNSKVRQQSSSRPVNSMFRANDLQTERRSKLFLVLINHASSCTQIGSKQCIVKQCKEAKIVVEHIRSCLKGLDCSFTPCLKFRRLTQQVHNKSDSSHEIRKRASHQSLQSLSSQFKQQFNNKSETMQSPAEKWRSTVAIDFRIQRIYEILRSILRFIETPTECWKRVKLLEHFSRMEADIFKVSGSAEEYKNLLEARTRALLKHGRQKRQRTQQQPDLTEKPKITTYNNSMSILFNQHEHSNFQNLFASASESNLTAVPHKFFKGSKIEKNSIKNTSIKKEPGEDMENVKASATEATAPNSTPVNSKPAIATSTPLKKKVFRPDELRQALRPTLEKLWRQDPESLPFRQPVDPQLLQIPDYFDIIKRPMDLSTIKRKLDGGEYFDPWQYVDDIWLMFDNAWLYNKKTSRVYKYCSKLSEIFESEIDPVMQSLGYCCGREYAFHTQVLYCYGKKLCVIARHSKYMSYQNRITYCLECFSDIPGDIVKTSDALPLEATTTGTQTIPKNQFTECKNSNLNMEPFVICKECGRKSHQICVLHLDAIWPEGFVCDHCLKSKGKKKKENRFTAKRLPQMKMGAFIEQRVNSFLREKESGAGEVYIRVVSSSDKFVEVKSLMRQKYVNTGDWPSSFPYRAKTILAFQNINGCDVCFFGMCVQEYGTNCSEPNSRRVHISYLDSVNLFIPKNMKTDVYFEIILGYLEFVKSLGFVMAHIWSCPPSEGSDYIFHCHPNDQKIPSQKRLQLWYKKLFQKGIRNGIVVDYKDILQHSNAENLQSAKELHYFEGDFWPNYLEESIQEIEQNQSSNDSTNLNTEQSNEHWEKVLTAKIYSTMEKHKEMFFVIRLHTNESAENLPPIIDPDFTINCELMDGCSAFLSMAHERNYEFSSLRRASFSTMALLCELHSNGNDKFVYTCNICRQHIVNQRYHCVECEDFDLCLNCYNKTGHIHEMEKLGSDASFSTTEVAKGDPCIVGGDCGKNKDASISSTKSSKESKANSAEQFAEILEHACFCRNINCRYYLCLKMKQFLQHTEICDKAVELCRICKILTQCSSSHARNCKEDNCPVFNCSAMKAKFVLQRFRYKRQLNHRYITTIQNSQQSPHRSQSILCKSATNTDPVLQQAITRNPILLRPPDQRSLLVQPPKLKLT